jgi:uncharacterized protein with GYD domain
MAWYMLRAKLTQPSVQGLVGKPHDRKAAVSKLVKALGGKLHHYFFCFGKHDVVLILELPGHDEAMALVMTAANTGAISDAETTVLVTSEDAVGAMKKAGEASGSYTPPKAK